MTEVVTDREPMSVRDFAIEAARHLSDSHCEDIVILDVTGLSQVCDYVLVGSGTSDRQMKSVSDDLQKLGKDNRHPCFRSSRDNDATWIVVDFVDLVVHLFEPEHRAYYDLEALWSDAPLIEWERE